MQKEERWRLWAAVAIVFAFAFLGLSALGAAWTFPHRYAPVATDFDTAFMGTLAANDIAPLGTAWLDSNDETYGTTPITVQDLTFLSERVDGVDVRIFAGLVRPRVVGPPAPGIVLVHGYGGTHGDMIGVARELAAEGYVAVAIDAPDSGQSTPYPTRTPENLVNVAVDPRNGFFFHVTYAASRALSVLESLPYVDGERLAVLGGSQGGIISLYLAARDPRVSAAVPIIPGGNLEEAFLAPSFAQLLVPRDLTPTDPRALAFRRHYDPLGYAPLIRVPVLFMAGTNDEFFPLPGVMETYNQIPAPKWLSLVPNHGHGAYAGWDRTVRAFLAWRFAGGPSLPRPEVLAVASDLTGVHVTAGSASASDIVLVFRESTAADRWRWVPMAPSGSVFTATAAPTWPGQVSLFVAVIQGGVFTTATPVLAAEGKGFAGPASLVVTAGMTAYLLGVLGVSYRQRIVPLISAVLSTAGSAVAWVGIPGRTSWGVYEIADRTNLGGLILAPFLLFFAALFTVALLFPRKMLLLSWIPVIFSIAVYGILYGLFGRYATIAPSWGFAALVAAPVLVLAERRWRKEPRVF